MVAIKSPNLPGVLSMTRVASPTIDTSVDPMTSLDLDAGAKPVTKTTSTGGINIKRSLSARGIIRSPSMPTTEVQQTASEAGGKLRTRTAASLLTRQHLMGRSTPSATPTVTPVEAALPADKAALATGLEASYISKASLRINEHVNRIFPAAAVSVTSMATPDVIYKGRIAPKPDRARDLGILVVSEVKACLHDQYLLRSLLRSAIIKAMSIFLSRLEGLVIMPTAEPTILHVPGTVRAPLAPAQRFAFEVVRCAYEVRRGLQLASSLEDAPATVEEVFRPWTAKMDAVVSRVIGPVIAEIKRDLTKAVAHINSDEPVSDVPHTNGRSLSLGRLPPPPAHPDDGRLRELGHHLDAARKLIDSAGCPDDAEKWIVALATTTVWKGMLALVSRNMYGAATTPAATMAKRRTLLPSAGGKRSPSPPPAGLLQLQARFLHDAEALHALVVRFTDAVGRLEPHEGVPPADACKGCSLCGGTILPDDLTSDSDSNTGAALAQEALHEALLALSSLAVVLRACALGAEGAAAIRAGGRGPCATLRRALDTCPPLVLLHLLAAQLPPARGLRLPHEVWGVGWAEYDGSLRGFASGEEWTTEVAFELLREVKRVRAAQAAAPLGMIEGVEEDWLTALEHCAVLNSQEDSA